MSKDPPRPAKQPQQQLQEQEEDDISDESSEDDLALDGELVRADTNNEGPPPAKRARTDGIEDSDDEDVPAAALSVDFVFCDIEERFFHGISQFLNPTTSIVRNSIFTDAMMASSVGTIISTSADQEDPESNGNVYGYASIIVNEQTETESTARTILQYCESKAPKTLQDTLAKPYFQSSSNVGILSHARMMNLPLELVPVLHQQLCLDLDYAMQHSDEQDQDEVDVRNLSHLIRLAPCYEEKGETFYKFFDDETLADAGDVTYSVANGSLKVILISLEAYRKAVVDLAGMFPSAQS